MPTYNTPGVYVQEISTIPPSVAPVATAVPGFVGYTEKGDFATPVRITSMLEFEQIFGGPVKEQFTAAVSTSSGLSITISPPSSYSPFILYYSMQMYFANGGGPCWVSSAGLYSGNSAVDLDDITKSDLSGAMDAYRKVDEPTLLVCPDAINLPFNTTSDKPDKYGSFVTAALLQCASLQDRFLICDVPHADNSSLPLNPLDEWRDDFRFVIGMNNLSYGAAYTPYLATSLSFGVNETSSTATGDVTGSLTSLSSTNPQMYRAILAKISELTVTLPPSGAMAGIYAAVDRDRGVWKAPANVSVNNVIAPTIAITEAQQGLLNVDATSGKSINAIRAFTGKGTLVWGARTLAGNDNEWRYINVRRLFIFIEESVKKATEFVVFEPNDRNTWLRVRTTINNFLTNLWRDGALVGATPDQAFFVKIGIGETMTAQDVLEGKLIVQIGLAASRPAEFIILQFQHKLQES